MWGWQREGARRAEEGEERVVVLEVEGWDEGSWCLMEVIFDGGDF